jgi:small-conductance mechanosensitive channel
MGVTDLTTAVRTSLSELGAWFAAQRGSLLLAAALLLLGWLAAVLLRAATVRLVGAVERVVPGRAWRAGLGRFGRLAAERRVADVVGLVVFWAVLLFFVAAATDALGLRVLSASLATLGAYVPQLVAAVLVLVVGLIIGNLARDGVSAAAGAAGAPYAQAVGQVVRAGILLAAALVAVAELGIDISLLTVVLAVALAALLGGFALAFGFGARTAVSNIIGSHYARQTYEVGQTVRLGDVEGTIATITAVAVVIRVPEGQVSVPAHRFSEVPSTLVVTPEGPR